MVKLSPQCQISQLVKKAQYYLPGILRESVTSAKYLGVDISSNLIWNEHINMSTKKSNQTLGFLRRNIKVKPEPIKFIAYQTLVGPQLEYASEVWAPYTQTHIAQLESV